MTVLTQSAIIKLEWGLSVRQFVCEEKSKEQKCEKQCIIRQ